MMRTHIREFVSAVHWRLTKPEYLFQPASVLRRFRNRGVIGNLTVRLNWGVSLRLRTNDLSAQGILRTGVDDLALSEVIWRLLAPGDTAVDVGANIGYVTSIMAAKVGSRGKVLAFEPHPGLCRELERNVKAWSPLHAQMAVFEAALSDRCGRGSLCVPPGFQHNRGVSRVLASAQSQADEISVPIDLRRLDDLCGSEAPIALVKIDVEGHELAVLKGAQRLLERGMIRNIVFEDFGGSDSESMSLLKQMGFTVWQFECELLGPRLSAPGSRKQAPWRPPNFLASLTPQAVEESLRPRGWKILHPRLPRPS